MADLSRGRLHYGWVVIFTGMLVTIGAHGFGRMSFTLILPAMKDGLELTYTQLGLLGTGNFIGYLIMALVGGILAARFGPRLVIALALLLMGITMILTGLARDFGDAFLMRLMTGLGNGAANVPAMALGSAWFAVRHRGLATGIVAAGIGGGTMIAGLIVPGILSAYGQEGWRIAWYCLGGAVLVIAGWAGLAIRNRPEDMGLRQVGADKAASPPVSLAGAKALEWGGIYKVKAVWYMALVYFMYGFSYIIYVTFFAAYLVKEMGLTQAAAGGLWAMVGGLSIFCGVLWGGISDRLGRGRGSALAYLVLAVAYLVMALVRQPFGFYVSAVVFGLTAWSIPTIMAAAAGDLVGPKLAPAGLGFLTLVFGIGQALGPSLGGYVADLTHSFRLSFILAAGVSLLGAVLGLNLRRVSGGKAA